MTSTNKHHNSCSCSSTPPSQPVFATADSIPVVKNIFCCCLAASANPVLHCKAKHNCAKAKNAKADDAEGLEKVILLAEGAKVMLTCNLWTSKGYSF